MTSLLTLPPVSGVAFDVEDIIPTPPAMRMVTSSLKELLAPTERGCLTGQPDQLCAFLDVGCSLIYPRWKE